MTSRRSRASRARAGSSSAWPPYFQSTPADQAQAITTLLTAAGGKAVISQQTATEQAAAVYGIAPEEEWARVQKDSKDDADKAAEQAKAFGDANDGGAGGKVPGKDDLPPGAKPKPKFGGSAAPFGQPKKDDDSGGSDQA